jgi:hypothetical protein
MSRADRSMDRALLYSLGAGRELAYGELQLTVDVIWPIDARRSVMQVADAGWEAEHR